MAGPWIIIIFFLSEDDPSGDGLKDDDELKPVDDVDWNWWPDELFSSWPALTSDEPLGVLPPPMTVSGPATGAQTIDGGSLNLSFEIFDKSTSRKYGKKQL